MRIETYETKENKPGKNNWLEEGDEITILDSTPRQKQFGKYPNYSIKAIYKGEEMFVRLTKGQFTRLNNTEFGDLKGKIFKGTTYPNPVKANEMCVGIELVQ